MKGMDIKMRFAYLIMAHHRFDILKLLLEDLDDERNDIFLHIDWKSKDFEVDLLDDVVHKAKLILVDRIPVYWGDFSQILCELKLLKAAVRYGYHDYYHLLAGVEFPIKSQNEIYSFFKKYSGYEFVGYDDRASFIDRVRYFYFFQKYRRCKEKTWIEQHLYDWGGSLLDRQAQLGVNRVRYHAAEYKKGYANWSITHELACYIVSQERKIKRKYRNTLCADEIFLHTLVYNSSFYDKVYDKEDEYHSAMRLTTWEDKRNQFHMDDLPMILKSDRLFARKFDSEDAVEIINQIVKYRR